jgi:hypothetical protein
MSLRSLLRRNSDYVGHHAAERRAPAESVCCLCDKSEPGTKDEPIALAKCSLCDDWYCTADYTMHKGPDEFYNPPTRRAWWLRVIGRG